MSVNSKIITAAVVAAIVFGGAGFYGGTLYGKNPMTLSKTSRAGAMTGNFAGRNSGANNENRPRMVGARNGDGFIAGEVIAKDDKSITVKDRSGSSKIILYSSSTTVGKSVDGTASDLSAGENVMVTGTTNSDGSVTAENIQIRPATPQSANSAAPAASATN